MTSLSDCAAMNTSKENKEWVSIINKIWSSEYRELRAFTVHDVNTLIAALVSSFMGESYGSALYHLYILSNPARGYISEKTYSIRDLDKIARYVARSHAAIPQVVEITFDFD
ncbi:TPA: hypothetical protein QIZ63_004253 [Klebsiella aerogenes]|nr:hypothetical protein [Klebsiella aerogenes]